MENKHIPGIRFPEFSGEWKERKLSEFMNFSNGINAPKESYGKGRKMISVMDILDQNPMTYDSIRNSVEVKKEIEDKNRVENGDLVFVRSSEIVEEVGWTKAYLEDEYALYSGFAIRGKKKNDYDARFIELNLNSSSRRQIERKAGGSTRFNVSQSILKSIVIREPNIEEQTKLGILFKHLDDTIAIHQQELETLKQTKQGFLQKMFPREGKSVPEIRFPGFPGDWGLYKLDEVLRKQIKGKAKLNNLSPGNVEYLDANRLNGGHPLLCNADKNVIEEDILILWDGSNAGTVYQGFEGALGSTFKAYSVIDGADSSFIYQQLVHAQEKIYREYRTPNIPHVVKDFAEIFEIKLPAIEEQTKIGNFLKQLDDTIALHEQELETLKQTKKAFLQKMFV